MQFSVAKSASYEYFLPAKNKWMNLIVTELHFSTDSSCKVYGHSFFPCKAAWVKFNTSNCWYGILRKSIIEIFEFWYQVQYRFGMVLFVWRLHYSDDILMIDVQTDSIKHLPKLRGTNISAFDSKVLLFQHLLALVRTITIIKHISV